jgi:hypothetical protein
MSVIASRRRGFSRRGEDCGRGGGDGEGDGGAWLVLGSFSRSYFLPFRVWKYIAVVDFVMMFEFVVLHVI